MCDHDPTKASKTKAQGIPQAQKDEIVAFMGLAKTTKTSKILGALAATATGGAITADLPSKKQISNFVHAQEKKANESGGSTTKGDVEALVKEFCREKVSKKPGFGVNTPYIFSVKLTETFNSDGIKRHAASNDQYLAPPPDDDRAAQISRPSGKSTKLAAMAPAVQQVYPRPTYTGRTHRTKDPVVGGEVELALTDNVREHGLEPGHRGRLLTLETRSNTVEVLVDRGAGECVEHHKLHHRDVYHVVP